MRISETNYMTFLVPKMGQVCSGHSLIKSRRYQLDKYKGRRLLLQLKLLIIAQILVQSFIENASEDAIVTLIANCRLASQTLAQSVFRNSCIKVYSTFYAALVCLKEIANHI